MSAAGADRLGIVVVSYGSSALLERNLASIDRNVLGATEVVVVDNPTSSAERRRVRELAAGHGWHVEEPSSNDGFGAGVNAGVRRALTSGCTALLCLNPDVSIEPAAIEQLWQVVRAHPRTVVTPRLERPDGSVWFAGGQLDLRTGFTTTRPDEHQQGPGRWLTGACLLFDRASWDLTGGFDERYFMYWEDVDLSHRLLARGGDLLVCHDVVATHDVGGTQGSGHKSPLYGRSNCRNRLLFSARHLGPAGRLRWLRHAPRYAAVVLRRDGFRVALRRPAVIAAVGRGTLEGAAIVAGSLVADAWREVTRRRRRPHRRR